MKLRTPVMGLGLVLALALPNPSRAIEKDNFTSTCGQLRNHIRSVGVKDAGGNHPNMPGNTHSTTEPKSYKYDIVKEDTRTQFYCPASDTYYDNIGECQKPPSQGGCRTVIGTIPCTPKYNRVCIVADVTISFSGTHTSTRLHWATQRQSEECMKDVARWYKTIETHESRHVKDAKELVEKWNKDYKKKALSACGDDKAKAKKELEDKKIKPLSSKANDELITAIKKAGDVFHATKAGQPTPPPSCRLCGSGDAGAAR